MKRALYLLVAVSLAAFVWVLVQQLQQPAPPPAEPVPPPLQPAPSQLVEPQLARQRADAGAAPEIIEPVAGIVRRPDGRPLAAAQVTLLRRLAPAPTREVEPIGATLLTAANGRFTFGHERVPGLQLEIASSGYATTRVDVPVADPDLEIRLAPGFDLQGIVESPDGNPLGGCTVFVEPNLWSRTPAITTTTSERGSFRFRALGADVVRVTARHPDFQPETLASVTIGAPGLLRIRLSAEDLVLRGRVVASGPAQSPVAGAEVRLFPPSWNGALFVPFTGRTASDGSFAIQGLGPTNQRIEVRHPDYSTAQHLIAVRRDSPEQRIELVPRARVGGRIRSGKGLGDARLWLSTSGGELGHAIVAKDGSFDFPGSYSAGNATLRLLGGDQAFGANGERSQSVRIEEAGATDVEVALVPAARVTGSVLGADGRPLAGVKVQQAERLSTVAEDSEVLAVTEAAGRFEILSLPRGRVLLRLRHPEHAVRDVEVDVPGSGETATLDPLQLHARVEVRGRVLRGARPLAGAIVFANQGQAVVEHAATGADGTFVLRELGPGTHRIRARFSTLKVETLEPPLVVVPGQPLPELEIRFEPGRIVRGTVVDEEGRPVPDALVMVADEALAAVRTGPDGQFAVEAPFEATQLRVIRFEPMLVARRSVPKDATEPIEIRLPLGPRGGLQVKLLALPARAPVAGAIVRLEPRDPPSGADPLAAERRRVAGRFVAATAGMLEVIELPAGRAMLTLEAPGFAPHSADVEIPPNAQLDLGTILLEPGACFAGRVVDPLGRPIAGAAVHLGRELDFNLPGFAPTLRSDANGEFVVRGVGPQSRELYVRAPGHATGAHSIAIPEELLCDDPVPIVLPRGARLQVRVEDPDGRDAGLVTVLLRRRAATLAVGFTADDGRVMFDHLRPGKYELHLPQHRDQPVLIELPPDAQQIDTVVEIEREER